MITAQGLTKLGFTPEVDFSLQDDGQGVFFARWMSDQPQPSEADIIAAHNEWQAEYDNVQYSRDRAVAYPPMADQLDDIFHNGVDGWKATIQAVKDTYPKPV
jgi:hypothetical protein